MFFNRLVLATTNTDKQFKKEIYFLWRKPKKMKHAKRLFCGALALIMALSLAAVPAFADNNGSTPTKYTKLPLTMTLGLDKEVEPQYIDSIPLFVTTISLESDTSYEGNTTATQINSSGAMGVLEPGVLPEKPDDYQGTDLTDDGWADLVLSYSNGNDKYKDSNGETYANHEYKWAEIKDESGAITGYYDENTTKDVSFDFSNVTFEDTGYYVYTLTVEHKALSSSTNASLSFLDDNGHKDIYDVIVAVASDTTNGTTEFYISDIIVKANDVTGVTKGTKVYTSAPNVTMDLNEGLSFRKVTITNEVKGDDSRYDDEFIYHIVIPVEGATTGGIELGEGSEILGYKTFRTDKDGKKVQDDEAFSVEVSNDGADFTLKQGESLVLFVPDTMIFTVTQETGGEEVTVGGTAYTAPEGYSTTHEYAHGITKEGTTEYSLADCEYAELLEGTDHDDNEAAEGETDVNQLNHNGHIYDTMDNWVHFINTKTHPAPTGITMDILPYVVVVAAAAALAVLMIAKKKKTDW
jgi:hypothetical protein